MRGIAVGNLFPQLQQAFGELRRETRLREHGANPRPNSGSSNWDAGFNASWELDFWGRFRRAIEAADAELDASIENYDDVLVVLLADVATNYVHLSHVPATAGVRPAERRDPAARPTSWRRTSSRRAPRPSATSTGQSRSWNRRGRRSRRWRSACGRRRTGCAFCWAFRHGSGSELGAGPRAAADAARGGRRDSRPTCCAAVPTSAGPSARWPPRAPASASPRRTSIRASRSTAPSAWRRSSSPTCGNTPGSLFGAIGPAFRWDILNYGRILNNVRAPGRPLPGAGVRLPGPGAECGPRGGGCDRRLPAHPGTGRTPGGQRRGRAANGPRSRYDQYRQGPSISRRCSSSRAPSRSSRTSWPSAQGNIALNLIAIYRALGGGWEMRLSRDGNGHDGEWT